MVLVVNRAFRESKHGLFLTGGPQVSAAVSGKDDSCSGICVCFDGAFFLKPECLHSGFGPADGSTGFPESGHILIHTAVKP